MKKVIAMMLTFVLVFSVVANMGVCVSAETTEADVSYILDYDGGEYKPYLYGSRYSFDHSYNDPAAGPNSVWSYNNCPEIFNLVNSKTGESNPAYCTDADTSTRSNSVYRRINLEDSTYHVNGAAGRLRAIILNTFPCISVADVQKAANEVLGEDAIQNLQQGELISATQQAIWKITHGDKYTVDDHYDRLRSMSNYDVNDFVYPESLDAEELPTTESNMEKLYEYFLDMEAMAPMDDAVSEYSFEKMNYVVKDNGNGTVNVRATVKVNLAVDFNDELTLSAVYGDNKKTIELTKAGYYTFVFENVVKADLNLMIEGFQTGGDVYLFDAYGERGASQSMIGYDKSKLPVYGRISLSDEGKVEEGIDLQLLKTAKVNGEATDIPVSGATFDLVKTSAAGEDTKIYTGLVTDENGKIDVVAPALAEGEKYYFVETNAPSGYKAEVKEGETVKAYVDAVNATASYYNTGDINITVHKTNTDKTVPLSGAQFELKLVKADGTSVVIKNGDSTVFTTDAEGNIAISGLIPGNYVLTEVKAPEGYEIKADQKETNLTLTGEDKGKTITVTNDITKGTGKITVTKQMGYFDTALMEVVDLIANETEYYVGIFKDDQGKQPFGTDYVKKITIKGTSSGTAVFENLPVGTYYIFETDEKGNPVPFDKAQTTNGVQWACQIAEGSSQKVEFGVNMTNPEGKVGLYNMYYTFPDGFYMKGEIEISKKVLVDGKETTTDEKFYAGIFKDKEGKELYRNVELVQGDSVKVEVPLGGENGDEAITYYVYETDANGNRIGEAFAYDVTGEGAVTLDKSKSTGKIELINEKETVKETEETEETEEDEETTEDETSKSTKTGDNTPIMLYLVLAVAALAGVFVVFFKKHKTE